MTPDDPRHGTMRGYTAHRRAGVLPACGPCKAAATKDKQIRQLEGAPRRIPALGAARRVRALSRLGWTWREIGEHAGVTKQRIGEVTTQQWVTPDIHARIDKVFRDLAMVLPPSSRRRDLTRLIAERHGYPPPLAWDNIDDINEQPTGWEYQPPDRLTTLTDLDELGLGITQVCRRMGVGQVALEKWCRLNNATDLFRRICDREHRYSTNASTKDVA